MKKGLKTLLVLLLALTMVWSLAACGGSGDSSGDSSSEPAEEGSESEGEGEEVVSENRTDGSIIFSVDWPAYIDPGVGNKAADEVAHLNLYDSLTFPNPDATVSGLLAESWDANPEATEYTFHMVKNATFHSGNPVTANDVKFSFDRLITMGEGYAYLFADVKSCEVVDDYTVKFTLGNPSGSFPNVLIRLYVMDEKTVMEHLGSGDYGDFGDYGKAWLNTNDAGSGPYKVKEMRMEDSLTMEKATDYWRGWDDKPNAPDTVIALGTVDATTVRTLVARNELDITDGTLAKETLDSIATVPGMEIVNGKSSLNFNITLNTKTAPTDDVHVRRAMAYAFDYDTACNQIYTGSTKPTGPIIAGMACALDESENPYTFDLEKAEEELKQSAYYDDLKSGAMQIELVYCTEGGQLQEQLAMVVQAGLSSLGVTCNITGKPFATMMTDAATIETTPNASFVVFGPNYLEGSAFLRNRYHSSTTGTWEQMEWLQDPEIDKAIEDAMKIVDETERNEAYHQICLKLVDICPTIWACDMSSSYGLRTGYIKSPAVEDQKAGKDVLYQADYADYFRDFELIK